MQRKLTILNKAGLSKDDFEGSDLKNVDQEAEAKGTDDNKKITEYFSVSLTDEDIAALDEDWDGAIEAGVENKSINCAKKPRLM